MRIRIRDPSKVFHQRRPMFPPCAKWLEDHQGEEFTTIPEDHVHIMADGKRRTIPAEYVDVIP